MKNLFKGYRYGRRPILISIVAFVLSMCLLIVFFSLSSGLPDTVPTHFTNGVGIDGWGDKSELYPLPIIPVVFGALTIPLAVVFSKKEIPFFSYLASGVSLFVTVLMALVIAMFLKVAGAAL